MSRQRVLAALPPILLLGAAAGLFVRSLDQRANFDEGVYLASLDALRHGQALGTDVNVPQPPGFYVLLQAIAGVLGNTVTGVRVGFLLLALAGLAVAYAVGRMTSGRLAGIGAGAVLAVTAPYPGLAAQVEADTICTVLSLAAIAVLIAGRRSLWTAGGAGALAALGVSVKLLAVPVAAPLVVLLVARRSWRQAAALLVGAAVVAGAFLIGYSYALSELWASVVQEHRRAQSLAPSLTHNAHRVLLHPLDWHTPAGVLVPLGLVLALVLVRRAEMLSLASWIVASAAVLVYQRPLLDHHMVLIATALAIPAGIGLGAAVARLPRRVAFVAVAVVLAALAAGWAQEHRRLARNALPEPPEVRFAIDQLRSRTSPDELVATDLPIAAYLADRRIPGFLIDSSYGRLLSNTLTTEEILGTLEREQIRAVLVGRNYQSKPDLVAAIRARYPTRLARDDVTLYLRPRP